MLKKIQKIPGGMLLIPMLLSAIIFTIRPNLFLIGGMTEAIFTNRGLQFILAMTCFCSGTTLDLKKLVRVLKKQGSLIILKTLLCVGLGYWFFVQFGYEGVFGISAMTFIIVLCSTNPSLYLVLVQEFGTEDDEGAFGLIGLLCVPAYPMFVYGICKAAPIDWTPIISSLIPLLAGMLLGNLDKEMKNYFAPAIKILVPFMGWSFGYGINLLRLPASGIQGVLMTIIFYIVMAPVLYLFERFVLKSTGVSALAMSSIAGMSVSVPLLLAETSPELLPLAELAAAQITFGVVITSFLTPVIVKKIAQKNGKDLTS